MRCSTHLLGSSRAVLRELGVADSNVAKVMALLQGARNEVLNR